MGETYELPSIEKQTEYAKLKELISLCSNLEEDSLIRKLALDFDYQYLLHQHDELQKQEDVARCMLNVISEDEYREMPREAILTAQKAAFDSTYNYEKDDYEDWIQTSIRESFDEFLEGEEN